MVRPSPTVLVLLLLLWPDAPHAGDRGATAMEKLTEAARELLPKVPNHEWSKARCVTVLILGKGGFIFGGQGGTGAISCRNPGGSWSAPLLLKGGGTTVGAQIGGAKVSVLMTFKNIDNIDAVTRTIPVLGGAAQATVGTASAGVGSGGNPDAGAGVFTVSVGEGLYAGATFEGLAIDADGVANRDLYGRAVTAKAILIDRAQAAPAAASGWLRALSSR